MRALVVSVLVAGCGGRAAMQAPQPTPTPMEPAPQPTPLDSTPIVTSCVSPATDGGTQEQLAVPYLTVAGQTLLMDVAAPRTPGPHPMVLAIHGGGWSKGSRADFLPLIRSLAARGYVAATVEYRLAAAPNDVFPAAVQDVKCALRVLKGNAPVLQGDTSRVAVLGASAGGHLAAMVGTTPTLSSLDGPCPVAGPVDVKAVIALSGPMDLRSRDGFGTGAAEGEDLAAILRNFLGADPATVPAVAALASPITHVTPQTPPFFLTHGTADDMVLVDESRAMRDVLRDAGVRATLYEAADAGHGSGYTDAQSLTIACTMAAFLDATLKP